MDLKTYLIENELPQERFARQTGISFNCIANLCNRRCTSNLENAMKIVDATKGKVDYKDLLLVREKKLSKPRPMKKRIVA